jgi:hypothetical protein
MLDDFKADLVLLNSDQLIRKYILNGHCHVLTDNEHFRLKDKITSHFSVQFTDVAIVGSAKLGFSIKSNKRYQAFGESSDIDIAIVSTDLFNQIWKEAYLYKKDGAYWPKSKDFFEYLADGWIRPDKLPVSKYFTFTAKWWDFFNELTASKAFGSYKIRGGLYHSQFFFEEYQKINFEQCKEEKY